MNGFPVPDRGVEADSVASVVVAEDDADDARVEDSAPELDMTWPSANPAEPDSDALARRALLDSREVEAGEDGSGLCAQCLAGKPSSAPTPAFRLPKAP